MAGKPMTGQAFFVLTALAGGPRHGYGIVGEVAELSQGRILLKIGSLYGVLDRLAAEGLIEPDREEAHDGRLRRYYRLTRDGQREQADERRPGPGAAVPPGAAAAARLVPGAVGRGHGRRVPGQLADRRSGRRRVCPRVLQA